jgi:hypothetical protein
VGSTPEEGCGLPASFFSRGRNPGLLHVAPNGASARPHEVCVEDSLSNERRSGGSRVPHTSGYAQGRFAADMGFREVCGLRPLSPCERGGHAKARLTRGRAPDGAGARAHVIEDSLSNERRSGGSRVPHTSGYAQGASQLMWGLQRFAVSDRCHHARGAATPRRGLLGGVPLTGQVPVRT